MEEGGGGGRGRGSTRRCASGGWGEDDATETREGGGGEAGGGGGEMSARRSDHYKANPREPHNMELVVGEGGGGGAPVTERRRREKRRHRMSSSRDSCICSRNSFTISPRRALGPLRFRRRSSWLGRRSCQCSARASPRCLLSPARMSTDDLAVGIDLGTTYTCVGVWRTTGACRRIPSPAGRLPRAVVTAETAAALTPPPPLASHRQGRDHRQRPGQPHDALVRRLHGHRAPRRRRRQNQRGAPPSPRVVVLSRRFFILLFFGRG